ncbi:MAG: phosphate ABC transporter permease subunit PstC [Spirulina sp.]
MNDPHVPPKLPPRRFKKGSLVGLLMRERIIEVGLAIAAAIPVLISLAILGIFLYEAAFFFREVSLWQFLTDTQWTPLFASQKFGIFVLASATLSIATIAILVAVPLGLLAAIYLAEYAPQHVRRILKPALEALSGIPTIVYGYFALLLVTPFLKQLIPELGGFNALSAGLVTGILITPIVSAISEDAIENVPTELREGGYSLGFTKRENILRVILPIACPGIVAAVTLAASRALGETMIASIAAGQNPNLTLNPLVPVESMTAFIIQVSLGDVPANSFLFHTLFTVGFVLFLITLALNGLGHWLVRRHEHMMKGLTIPSAAMESDSATPWQVAGAAIATLNFPLDTRVSFEKALTRRQRYDRLFLSLTLLASLVGVVVLTLLLVSVLLRGIPVLDGSFLTSFASRKPDDAGIFAALAGTLWLLVLTAAIAFPIGVGAAIYLEEYLPNNTLSYILEIHLANLAAVPSIVYGLLGLVLFARVLQPVTGGRTLLSAALVLSSIVLPLVIITTRGALRSVSPSQRQAAFGVGMTRWQAIQHVILPSALPRIITGMLLALSRAIGETAPLIAVGAVAFVSFVPGFSFGDLQSNFTTLTTQIFYWLARPQKEFHSLAAATILVLGAIVLAMNIFAVLLRDFDRRQSRISDQ